MKKIALAALAFLFVCLFSGSAFAQSEKEGLFFSAGLQVPTYKSANLRAKGTQKNQFDVGAFTGAGIGIDVMFGYKWKHLGFAIEQQVDSIFASSPALSAKYWKPIDKNKAIFHGATYLLFLQYIPFAPQARIFVIEGFGSSYGSGNNYLFNTKSDSAFSLKLDLGITYFVHADYGLSFDVELAPALAFNDGVSISLNLVPRFSFIMPL